VWYRLVLCGADWCCVGPIGAVWYRLALCGVDWCCVVPTEVSATEIAENHLIFRIITFMSSLRPFLEKVGMKIVNPWVMKIVNPWVIKIVNPWVMSRLWVLLLQIVYWLRLIKHNPL